VQGKVKIGSFKAATGLPPMGVVEHGVVLPWLGCCCWWG